MSTAVLPLFHRRTCLFLVNYRVASFYMCIFVYRLFTLFFIYFFRIPSTLMSLSRFTFSLNHPFLRVCSPLISLSPVYSPLILLSPLYALPQYLPPSPFTLSDIYFIFLTYLPPSLFSPKLFPLIPLSLSQLQPLPRPSFSPSSHT